MTTAAAKRDLDRMELIPAKVDNGHTGAMSVYERMGNPLEAMREIGRVYWMSGVGGCKTKEHGECLALACMCKGMDPFEFSSQYHLIDGKPTLQAHVILARIRQAGGKVKWINDGEDLVEASAEFKIDNETRVVRYRMVDALQAGVVKDGSTWRKTPSAMLRAAMMRKGAKMMCPEVLVGDVDPEEFASDGSVVVSVATPAPSQNQIEARRRELQSLAGSAPEATDATVDTPAAAEQPPFEVPDRPAADISPDYTRLTALLMEIEQVAGKAGLTREVLEQKLKAANPTFAGLENIDVPAAEALLANLTAKVAAMGK